MVFALLGPVIAIASLGDSRWQGRRQGTAERIRFDRELAVARQAIERAHEREVDGLNRLAPAAAQLLGTPAHDPERWRGSLAGELFVALGTGPVASELNLDPGQSRTEPDDAYSDALEQLRSAAAAIESAPMIVDARLGIGVCGPTARAISAANAIVMQLANALPPPAVELWAPASGPLGWLALLPQWSHHSRNEIQSGPALRIEFRPRAGSGAGKGAAEGEGSILVAVAEYERDLPRECRVVVHLGGPGPARLARHPDRNRCGPVLPEFASAQQGRDFAELLRAAGGDTATLVLAELPALAAFAELPQPRTNDRNSLACTIGLGQVGLGQLGLGQVGLATVGDARPAPVTVDLVADGPHAVIGGTTGSGKSELLVTWVLAMAAASSPEQVNFLLVDFKGGASFGALRDLPHCVGLVTDLDESAANRAMQSLRAELRYRERVLAGNAVRSIAELDDGVALPRLVIVVDEFATLTSGFPELHELFADLAARGRSLGLHLILCTQRPAGVVRDAVLANCALRLSLRVNNRADSVAVIGSPDAAELPRHPVGRALLVSEGSEAIPIQLARASEQDVAAVASSWASVSYTPRRPWLDPPPAQVLPENVPGAAAPGFAFGIVDLPGEQRQEAAVYDPAGQGSLLVVGGHHSGKTGTLEAIARAALPDTVQWVPDSVEGAWDVVTAALAQVRLDAAPGRLLLLDDLDALLGRFPQDHEQAFVDTLAALLREGRRVGVHLAITASRVGSGVASIASLCEAKLILRMPDRQEHLVAGGSGAAFDPALPPGGGWWNGHRVQVVWSGTPEQSGTPRESERPIAVALVTAVDLGPALEGWRGLAVVAATPQVVADRLHSLGEVTMLGHSAGSDLLEVMQSATDRPRIILGDPDAWQSNWGLIGSLRASLPVAFFGCSVAEFRAITRSRTLPPPITATADTAWLLSPDGRVVRVRLSDRKGSP